jgi:hypothetical protein
MISVARMECYCGAVLSNSSSPNEVHLRVYTDKEFEQKVLNKLPHLTDFPEYDVWRCPQCERLYFFKDGQLKKLYVLDIN